MPKFCPNCNQQNNDTAKFCASCGLTLAVTGTTAHCGTFLQNGRYEILHTVKAGGMGCIYRARDCNLDMVVAIKKLVPTLSTPADLHYTKTRFRDEAKMLSKLHHSGLPKVTDYFEEKDSITGTASHYLVMTFIEGKDLETLIKERRQQPFPVIEVIDYATQILDILHYLHNQNPSVIYRDLNPRNIMVQGKHIFLVDFGIARHFKPQVKGTAIGTAGYAPPEQYKGMAEPRSDIYSLGAVMHYLITGQDPESTSRSLFSFASPRSLNPDVPDALDSLITSMVDLVPDKRPSSSSSVAASLVSIKQGHSGTKVSPAAKTQKSVQKMKPAQAPSETPEERTKLYPGIFDAIREGDLKTVEAFLITGTSVDTRDKTDSTPLHRAASSGHRQIMELLLTHKADINAVNSKKQTPLHHACLYDRVGAAMYLISKGADLEAEDTSGKTALHIATDERNTKMITMLVMKGSIINACDNEGKTPLHHAALYNTTDIAELLITRGADIRIKDKSGRTPLDCAIFQNVKLFFRSLEKKW